MHGRSKPLSAPAAARLASRPWPAPSLLDRYLGGELLAALGFGVAVFGALLVGNEFFYLGRTLLDRGVPAGAFLELLLYRVP